MRVLICALAMVWGLILTVEPALAECTQYTVMGPNGQVRMCQSCCLPGGMCQVHCL